MEGAGRREGSRRPATVVRRRRYWPELAVLMAADMSFSAWSTDLSPFSAA